jgi:acetyl esterase/lipase
MNQEIYPGLDPELNKVVQQLEEDFSTPPDQLSPQEFRDLMIEIGARNPIRRGPELQVTDTAIPTNAGDVQVRIFEPTETPSQSLLIYMHGGGWTVGSLDSHDPVCSDIAIGTGFTVVSIDYALSPEHRYPVALNQCLGVFDRFVCNLTAQHPHIQNVFVGGDSAGANLASAICLWRRDNGESLPDGQLLLYPAVDADFTKPSYESQADAPFLYRDLLIAFWKNYLGENLELADQYACPARAEDLGGLPPAIVMTAALDPLVDEGDAFAQQLITAGVPTYHRRGHHLIHGYLRFRGFSNKAQNEFHAMINALKLLEANLAG